MFSRPQDPLPQSPAEELNYDLRLAAGELFSAHYAVKRLALFYSPEDLMRYGDREILHNAVFLAAALHEFLSPLAKRLETADPEDSGSPALPAAPRVVVADDHAAMRNAVVSLLQPGFEVVGTAADGLAALTAIGRLRPDLAVLDVSMPVLGGIAVARRLREMGSRIRIVFLTAQPDAATLAAAREADGLGFVLKTSLDTDLVLAVQEALAGRSFVSSMEH